MPCCRFLQVSTHRSSLSFQYADASAVQISGARLENNDAEAGVGMSSSSVSEAFTILSPTAVHIADTVFEPFKPGGDTVTISPGAVGGVLQGGCVQNPCALGTSCEYAAFSTRCTPVKAPANPCASLSRLVSADCNDCSETHSADFQCTGKSAGLDGLVCEACPNGYGPNTEQTGCENCSGNNVSTFGVCVPCSSTLLASSDHDSCEDCGFHRTAVATGLSSSGFECGCEDNWYNGSAQVHVCFADEYDLEQNQRALEDYATSVVNTGQECATCPVDVTGLSCLSCSAGSPPKLAAGFTTPHLVDGEENRRPLLASPGGTEITAVFRCHPDMELAVVRCPADPAVPGTCAVGYSGYLCDSCDDSYGMNSKRACDPCEETGYTFGSLGLFIGFVAGITLVAYGVAKYWKQLTWKHFARCTFQPGRILITYSQVTSQLGDVLDFTYPGVFGDVIEFLRPLMDLWGLVFRALGWKHPSNPLCCIKMLKTL